MSAGCVRRLSARWHRCGGIPSSHRNFCSLCQPHLAWSSPWEGLWRFAVSTDLSVTVADGVALLEMCRPPANYFDEALIGAIVDNALRLDEDPACRVIVLASEGKHFCAGADFGGGDFAHDRV